VQSVERPCERCGEAVASEGEGEGRGCESCDVVVCAACLKSGDRCPKCQRPLGEVGGEPPRVEEAVDPRAERGRRQALAVAVSLVGAVLVVALLGGSPLGAVAIQLFALGLLLMQLFRGRPWARWALVAPTGLGALANAAAGVEHAGTDSPWMLSLGLAVIFGWSALVLAVSRPLASFLRGQRARHS
jgi:hypothetical protein